MKLNLVRWLGWGAVALFLAVLNVQSLSAAPTANGGGKPPGANPGKAHRFAPGQVLVQFKDGASQAQIEDAVNRGKLKLRHHIQTEMMRRKGHRGLDVMDTPVPVEQAIASLKNDPAVEFAEPNWVYTTQISATSDPYYASGSLWGMDANTGSPDNPYGSQAAAAWAAGVRGTNAVYVGVIDEGMEWQHPDLVSNIWTNPYDKPGDGIDNDGNGYVDDVHGWNFEAGNNQIYTSGTDDHGTHVAGTIGALGGNGIGVAGVNWHVTIIPVKFLGPNGGNTSDAVKAVDYLVDLKQRHGLNIVAINASWGGAGYSQALNDAIIRAAKVGILFVAAAGNGDSQGIGQNNDITPDYPADYNTSGGTPTESAASFNSVISVAAIDRNGALAPFSNFGANTVSLGAPGVGIWSTVPVDNYAAYSGTSMATPHVTGAIALYASTHPGASAKTIRDAILNAVTPTPSLAGKTVTGGRLNLSTVVLPASSGSTNKNATPARLAAQSVSDSQFRLLLKGAPNQVYEIQVSPNLVNWTALKTVTNLTGTVSVTDSVSSSWPQKFYRAIPR